MMNRLRYALKKKKIKLYVSIRKEFDDETIKELNKKQKIKKYLKKCICHPISLLKAILKKEFNIKYIEIVLTTKCTLNCKGCSALMNYYNKKYDTDIDKNIEALKRILNSCDSIYHLRLLGGEPLLYPKLYELLEFLNKQNKIKKITIVTNGTLLIKNENIIKILKNSLFNIFISNYGINSRKKEELINQLKENNIRYVLGKEDSLWRDYGDLENRNRKEKELRKQFLNCKIMCTSILDGKLHHCPRSSHGTNLKKIPLKKQDYIDLLDKNIDEKQLRKELYKFFYKYVPYIEACNYCNSATKELNLIPAGEQYKK